MGGGDEGGDGGSSERQAAEEARKTALRSRINSLYGIGGEDPEAMAARQQMEAEERQLADSTRGFYGEDLKYNYDRARRNNTFALADRGLLGGKAQVDSEAELARDNTMGATRLEDEVKSAVSGLRNAREGERLNATTLVNAGSGEDAVSAAQAGLSRAMQNAAAMRKTSIASDLFAGGADAVAGSNSALANAAALQRYQNSLKTFFGGGGTSAKVTAT